MNDWAAWNRKVSKEVWHFNHHLGIRRQLTNKVDAVKVKRTFALFKTETFSAHWYVFLSLHGLGERESEHVNRS